MYIYCSFSVTFIVKLISCTWCFTQFRTTGSSQLASIATHSQCNCTSNANLVFFYCVRWTTEPFVGAPHILPNLLEQKKTNLTIVEFGAKFESFFFFFPSSVCAIFKTSSVLSSSFILLRKSDNASAGNLDPTHNTRYFFLPCFWKRQSGLWDRSGSFWPQRRSGDIFTHFSLSLWGAHLYKLILVTWHELSADVKVTEFQTDSCMFLIPHVSRPLHFSAAVGDIDLFRVN